MVSDLHGQGYHPARVGQQPCRAALPEVRLQGGGAHPQLLRQVPAGKLVRVQARSLPSALQMILQLLAQPSNMNAGMSDNLFVSLDMVHYNRFDIDTHKAINSILAVSKCIAHSFISSC